MIESKGLPNEVFNATPQRRSSHFLAVRASNNHRQIGSETLAFFQDLAAGQPRQSNIQQKHIYLAFVCSQQIQCGISVACLDD